MTMTELDFRNAATLQIAERIRDVGTRQGRIPFLTGDLRKSVQAYPLGPGKAAVGSNLSYAAAVHDGRKAVTIRPKNKKALHFFIGGQEVFCKSVKQPARDGTPFLHDAAKGVGRDLSFLSSLVNRYTNESLIIPKAITLHLM